MKNNKQSCEYDLREDEESMICPKCGNEMTLRYYKSPEEALKDALRYLPPEMIGKPVWFCKKCLAIVPGW